MDTGILYGIQELLGNPAFDAAFPILTNLGELGAFWVALGTCMLFSRKWRFWGLCILVCMACVGLFNELGIKHLVGRMRPYLVEGYTTLLANPPTSFSFPSGHTGTSFAAATVIALSPVKRYWKAGAWILACFIAFTRMYLFVHWPTDVLVGAILGVLYGIVVVKIAQAIRARRADKATHGQHARV